MISVYMPVYNGEQYIRKSIESILNQTYQDFELILIDDCSTDTSAEICEEYYKLYPEKIVFIKNEKNMGIANTLNRGLRVAKGDYVLEVSDDDWIDIDVLERGTQIIKRTASDVVLLNRKGDVNGRIIEYSEINESFLGEMSYEKKKKLLTYMVCDAGFVYWGLVKRTFIEENSLYYDDISPEDIPYVPIMMMLAQNIAVISGAYYHYRVHDGSIAHKKNSPLYLTIHKSALLMMNNVRKRNLYEGFEKEWEYAFVMAFYYDSVFNQMARFDKRRIDLMEELATYMRLHVTNYQENPYVKAFYKPWQKKLMQRNDESSKKLSEEFPNCDEFLQYVRSGEIESVLV